MNTTFLNNQKSLINEFITNVKNDENKLASSVSSKIYELLNNGGGVLYYPHPITFRHKPHNSFIEHKVRYIRLTDSGIKIYYNEVASDGESHINTSEDEYIDSEHLSTLGLNSLLILLDNCLIINPDEPTPIKVFVKDGYKSHEEIEYICMILPQGTTLNDINEDDVMAGYHDSQIFYYYEFGEPLFDYSIDGYEVLRAETI